RADFLRRYARLRRLRLRLRQRLRQLDHRVLAREAMARDRAADRLAKIRDLLAVGGVPGLRIGRLVAGGGEGVGDRLERLVRGHDGQVVEGVAEAAAEAAADGHNAVENRRAALRVEALMVRA